MQSIMPCAPSKSTRLSGVFSASLIILDVSVIMGVETLRQLHILTVDLAGIESLEAEHLEFAVLHGECGFKPLAEIIRFEEIAHAQTYPAVFVTVCRSNPFLGGTDESLAETLFICSVG